MKTPSSRTARAPISSPPPLPLRARDGHKGDFGRVLIVAGSVGMPGAALLATLGALRGGAGLVTLATVGEIVPWLVGSAPSAMYLALPATKSGGLAHRAIGALESRVEACDVIAIGPGLGRDPATTQLVRTLVARSSRPIVLDADGLNAFESDPRQLADRHCSLVVTPHPGEFLRLDGGAIPTTRGERISRAREFARRLGGIAVVVLKGDRTVVTDGVSTYVNTSGNPGMATGGSGDVLTGVVAALCAIATPFDAAAIGVHVHGLAGDLAAQVGSETSLIAPDLLAMLPRAFGRIERRSRR